jgi:predicted permease
MQMNLSSLLLMLIMIAAGFILNRTKLMRIEHLDALPAILLNAAYPALILNSGTSVDIRNLAAVNIAVVAVTTAVMLLLLSPTWCCLSTAGLQHIQ